MPPGAAPADGPEATADIDRRLEALPAEQRAVLQAIRETVRSAAPEAVEAISYGMPAFRYRGRPLVGYQAAKAHCSLFPMSGSFIDTHPAEFEGYDTAKGTMRFATERPPSPEFVAWLVRERMAEVDRGAKG